MESMPLEIRTMRASVQSLQAQATKESMATILKWLSPLSMSEKLNAVLEKREMGTGGSILHDPSFLCWQMDESYAQILWLHGDPGVGKTMSAAVIIDNLRQKYAMTTAQVLYCFCDHQDTQLSTARSVLAVLAKQAASTYEATDDGVERLASLYNPAKDRSATFQELKAVLIDASAHCSSTTIAIDALDECTDLDERQTLIETLYEICEQAQRLKLVVKSRRGFEDIEEALKGSLDTPILASVDDLQQYVHAKVYGRQVFYRRIKDIPGLLEEVCTQTVARSGQIFLIAILQTEWVMHHRTVHDIRNALSALPERLEESYDKTLDRIFRQPGSDRKLALRVLAWLTHAQEFLEVNGMCNAIASGSVEDIESLSYPSGDNVPLAQDLLTGCVGLVVLETKREWIFSDNIQFVRLIHYSTKEYLLRHSTELFSSIVHAPLTIEGEIARTCLATLYAVPRLDQEDTNWFYSR
jgi:hypothetical protein